MRACEVAEYLMANGGPGSGSWDAPGQPRFDWQSEAARDPRFVPLRGVENQGHKLVGYKWQSTLEEREHPIEGMVLKRVSDWEDYNISEPTGRKIVHQYFIEHPDKTVHVYGKPSMEEKMGLRSDEGTRIQKKAIQEAQTRARNIKLETDDLEKRAKPTIHEAARLARQSNYSSMRSSEENDALFNQTKFYTKDGKFIRVHAGTETRQFALKHGGWKEYDPTSKPQAPNESPALSQLRGGLDIALMAQNAPRSRQIARIGLVGALEMAQADAVLGWMANQLPEILNPEKATDVEPNPDSKNFQAAAGMVLRGAALTGVGKWLAGLADERLAKLKTDLGGFIRSGMHEDSLLALADRAIHKAYHDLNHTIEGKLARLSISIHRKAQQDLRSLHGTKANQPNAFRPSTLLIAGATVSEWLDQAATDMSLKFKSSLRKALDAELKGEELVDRVLNPSEGVLKEAANASPLTVMISTKSVFDTAMESMGKLVEGAVHSLARAVDDGLLDDPEEDEERRMGWRWLAVLDEKICPVCEALDGSMWDSAYEPLGDSEEFEQEPPLHPNCRCQLVSVDLDEDELPRNVKLDTYFKSVKPKNLEAVFGKASADGFRRGELSGRGLLQSAKPMTDAEFDSIESFMAK